MHADPYEGCFAATGIQGSSVVLTCLRWYPSQPGVITGYQRILSKIASRGITWICTVTVFTNIYWRWANHTEKLPFRSVGLLCIKQGAAGPIEIISVAHIHHGNLLAQNLVNGRSHSGP